MAVAEWNLHRYRSRDLLEWAGALRSWHDSEPITNLNWKMRMMALLDADKFLKCVLSLAVYSKYIYFVYTILVYTSILYILSR
jgi:hypothetical protein